MPWGAGASYILYVDEGWNGRVFKDRSLKGTVNLSTLSREEPVLLARRLAVDEDEANESGMNL